MVGINKIADNVARKVRTSPKEAKTIIYTFLEEIVEYVEMGYTVNLRGLGNFYTKYRAPRKGTNPITGERITIPPRKVLVFKPTKEIKYL